ncbi:ATP-dependent Zn protease [Cyanobacterium stanieri LEGE 03274]|uniref:ATP-dependent Zn protease n=1 Tax=Cyanobacterium stanieri LEGE 03274 TaxID=1828756 RepID=A0ABR9V4L7_9CHRO|nr:ATP-dependent Zn protease [Cyanobacterium stanieri]MBE9222839.1 ATP-dependent Zn protease [Cyanobacterium stanieri LEGE 03274]
MQQTGLNILAITIFTVTLSVLLGPLLNISPYIPAGGTFIILSLITVDTLSWENKGVNLLINIFASAEQKERIIYHEAGHFLTAHLFNIPIKDYTLTAWETLKKRNGGTGGVIFDIDFLEKKGQDMREFNLLIERFGVVLMGGIAAEKLQYHNSEGGQEDLLKFAEIYAPITLTNSNLEMRKRLALLQATTMIETHNEAYLKLIEFMRQRKSVEECQGLLNESISLS